MELSLRTGMGATVVNPDGTISVVIDPNAANVAPIVGTQPNAINYGSVDNTAADLAALQASGESCIITGDCVAPTAAGTCPTGLVLSNGLCVQGFAGIPTTTIFYMGAAILALLAFSKGGR